ncbi:MAG: efflux RND transporter periplasmic adaptor subunit [Bacteroidales bacterium]
MEVMKGFWKKHIIIFLVMLPAVVSCDILEEEEDRTEPSPVLVELTELETTTLTDELHSTGVINAYEEAYVGAPTPSRIEEILVDVGDQVEKDQLLVQMDRTQLHQARVQLDNLKADLRRLDTLLEIGAVTQQNYEQLKTQYEVAKSNVENLAENTRIRANIPGVITGRYFSDGEVFSMSPTTPEGKIAIVSLKQIDPVKVMIGVSERYFSVVEKGQEATLELDIFPGRTFTGTVYNVYPTIDRRSGTFQVEILVENDDQTLRPGMYARVSLNVGEVEGLLVPALAVRKQSGSDERFVFVVEDGIAHRRVVELGRTLDDKQEILKGVEAGEMLVTTGQHNLMDQDEVEIVNQ